MTFRFPFSVSIILKLTVSRVSASGEFPGLIQAADVAEWKEQHASVPENPDIRALSGY
jgi:hypothetical protein